MDFEAARVKMVDNQIRPTDVTSHTVLSAFLDVPRDAFVPEKSKLLSYIDTDIQIAPASAAGGARYMMEPSPLAKLLQLAEITEGDTVLEVGCGSGYTSAILSHLAASVVALESNEALVAEATATLDGLQCSNVTVVTGELEKGQPAKGPYDVIFLNGAVEVVPEALLSQLKDGGRLIAVQGYGNAARAKVFSKERGTVAEWPAFNASVKPLPGFRKAADFVF
ncbi:protein-L-isoaspartate O-methyltransferase family protein [Pararhizobium sp.]|uniref:protein-L-isoaspartate O-methyltransferase family protein n=1 Tax=Pararhizobium sp. TaxID=1977563 RepID=UPI00271AD394|nr:protein-L-isoaspartate O-methyltransferase [Pararhizobium sp.]MDO9417059.1 protein-L-isoaspartate O-methyltransferase [Pararhizobium sp.]